MPRAATERVDALENVDDWRSLFSRSCFVIVSARETDFYFANKVDFLLFPHIIFSVGCDGAGVFCGS